MSGTVRDPSGAAIVGAHLVLKDEAGKVRDAQTDREGAYHFSTLQAGHYSLSAESQGFQAQSREVSANGQEALTVNFVIVVRHRAQSVTVTDRLDRQSDYTPSETNETDDEDRHACVAHAAVGGDCAEAVLREQNALTLVGRDTKRGGGGSGFRV